MAHLRPDRYKIVEGSTELLELDLAPIIGANTISTFTITAPGLTFTTPNVGDRTVTTQVSGGTAGTNYIATTTSTLADGQIIVLSITLEWKAPGYEFRAGLN